MCFNLKWNYSYLHSRVRFAHSKKREVDGIEFSCAFFAEENQECGLRWENANILLLLLSLSLFVLIFICLYGMERAECVLISNQMRTMSILVLYFVCMYYLLEVSEPIQKCVINDFPLQQQRAWTTKKLTLNFSHWFILHNA